MKKILFLLCFATNMAVGQVRICSRYAGSTYKDSTFMGIKNAYAGTFYARCLIAPEYEIFPDSNFTVLPTIEMPTKASFKVIEPVIEEIVDSIVAKSGVEWILNPKQKIPKGIKIIPPVYAVKSIQKEAVTAATQWIHRRGDMNGLSQNPDDCMVFGLVEIPAQYRTETTHQTLKPPRKVVGKDTINLDSTELKRFGIIKTYTITYLHQELKSKGEIIINYEPNIKYLSPTKKLVRKGGVTEWKVCVCGCVGNLLQRNPLHIQNMQKALKARGYYKGKINNVLDALTKAALVKFQKDNGLPIGSFDLQTLKALGVEAFE
jgi:hypothetical protein